MNKIKSVVICGKSSMPHFGRYKNGQIVVLFKSVEGFPMLKATTNLRNKMKDNQLMVKDKESFELLKESGVIKGDYSLLQYGHNNTCLAFICNLNINPDDYPELLM